MPPKTSLRKGKKMRLNALASDHLSSVVQLTDTRPHLDGDTQRFSSLDLDLVDKIIIVNDNCPQSRSSG